MTIDAICHIAGLVLHPHHALTGVALAPSSVPQVAPRFHRSL
jgi:hypothetical protein